MLQQTLPIFNHYQICRLIHPSISGFVKSGFHSHFIWEGWFFSMGNCIETCIIGQEEIDRKQEHQQKLEEGGFEKEISGSDEKRKVRIKVVLTKEELEWLVFQLEDNGGKSLEDVLAEMERCRGKLGEADNFRGKVGSWKPALESIMESPEVVDMDR